MKSFIDPLTQFPLVILRHTLSHFNLNRRCFWGGFQLTLITEVFSHLCWNVSSFGFEVSASQISASTLR